MNFDSETVVAKFKPFRTISFDRIKIRLFVYFSGLKLQQKAKSRVQMAALELHGNSLDFRE